MFTGSDEAVGAKWKQAGYFSKNMFKKKAGREERRVGEQGGSWRLKNHNFECRSNIKARTPSEALSDACPRSQQSEAAAESKTPEKEHGRYPSFEEVRGEAVKSLRDDKVSHTVSLQ